MKIHYQGLKRDVHVVSAFSRPVVIGQCDMIRSSAVCEKRLEDLRKGTRERGEWGSAEEETQAA